MSLRNLKSVFQDELQQRTEDFISKEIRDKTDTKFFETPPRPTINIATNPTDFSTAVGNNELPFTPLTQLGQSFMDGLSWETLYNPNHSFKDEAGHKGLVPINYPNTSRDNLNILDIGNDFRTAGLSQVNSLLSQANVENVDDFFTSRGVEPYIVSQIGDRETTLGGRGLPVNRMVTDAARISKYLASPSGVLFITKQEALGLQGQKYHKFYNPLSTIIQTGFRAGGGPASLLDRTEPNLGLFGDEYPLFNPNATPGPNKKDPKSIVTNLLNDGISLEDFGDGSPLGIRSLLDTELGNFQPQNFDLPQEERPRFGPFRPQTSKLDEFKSRGQEKLDKLKNKAENFASKNFGFPKKKKSSKKEEKLQQTQRVIAKEYPTDTIKSADVNKNFNISQGTERDGSDSVQGDVHTLAKMIKGNSLTDSQGGSLLTSEENVTFGTNDENSLTYNIEEEKYGLPFYFKDLRDKTYIFFRAYIEGLQESISPSYASHTYVGRSEPVYTYERGEREIQMTLKLFAQTSDELTAIYEKMDRLTSMCYPEYFDDTYGNRMKPPLARMRYGDLYGKNGKDVMGYLKSLSYSIEQSSPYETEAGKRVPKFVTATIGYQVIHDKAPRLGTKFYGINQ
tara:strand:- start:407 stop:2275 length:1869 start_codon:yes stop_codon:yes gene_type:complete